MPNTAEMFLVTDVQGNFFDLSEEMTQLILDALASTLQSKRLAYAGLQEQGFKFSSPKDFAIPQIEELINLFGG